MSAAESASALEAPGSSSRSVPAEHLDYSFIQSCSDLKHLEQILRVLRSGQDGFYPHLVEFCEKHIEKLDPKSRVLRKEHQAATAASFSTEEWRTISEDLQMWESNMRLKEAELKQRPRYSDAEHVPPVRSSNSLVQNRVSAAVKTAKTSRVPRPYRDWDRFDVDTECSNIDECDRNTRHASMRPAVPEITATINSTGLTAQEKDVLACREKDKGNGAFRSGDYEEAVVYYSRSLSLAPSVAALNNRAQAHIRLQHWSTALSDCDAVLQLEPGNVKALLRRATAHKHLGHQQHSHADLRAVLQIEPHNATALKLLMEETESDGHQETRRTGRKILIQEVDEEEEWLRNERERNYAQDEGREEKREVGCANTETDAPTNDCSSRRDVTRVDAHNEAPPTGHTHQRSEGHRPSGETLTERHTHNHSEHTTAEFELLKHDGNALVRSGCYQEAVDRYTGCLQLKPHECAVYTNRALCYIKLQRFTEARHDCDSALQLQPTNKKAFYRRALANKGLKDYAACRSDLQQVLCLDASVTEAEQLLMEVTQLMTDSRGSSGTRRTVTITEVDDDDDDEDDEDEGSVAVVSSVSLRSCDVFEFGQVLGSAVSGGDLLTCAELLRSVAPERLPRLISTQLDGHTLGFIIRALNTHLLHTHPELVFLHLQQLHTAHRLMAPGSSSRSVPAEHLDYSFIQSCSDLKHLEQILRVLRSGQDGFYPHLVEFCEKHIEKLDPKSRVLRKEHQAATAASFSTEEWRTISEDLQMWESNMRLKEAELKQRPRYSDAEHVPPVRSSNSLVQNRVSAAVKTAKTSRVPRPYRDWDRFDVDTECSNIDECDRNTRHASMRPAVPEITATINSTGLTAQEKDVLACREKDKGNGAFRSGDYEEAVVYYSRSLSLAPSVAALNNRAQAHIRLQHWSTALSDCDAVLQLEPGNVKALLRRATAHKHLGHQQHSHADLRAVLLIEPHNATALKLLMEETESDGHQETRRTGRKILIQEVDEEEEWLRNERERNYAQDEGREEKREVGCANTETDAPTNDCSSRRDVTRVDAHNEALPTGHTHQRSEGHRPSGETLTERHTHNHSEHTTAEFELLKHDGNALVRSGCYQEAVDRYTGCLQLKPHECAVYTNRALCYIKLQRFTEARHDCDSALQLQPTNKKAFYRRALANKGLKDYAACRSDLQQVLCLDASVTEAEQLLMEVTQLMTDSRGSSGTRRTVTITEVDDDDDDEDDEDEGSVAVVSSVSLRSCDVFEFGQVLGSAVSGGDLLTCAELLRSVAPERLPRLISTQLDGHTLGFIIRALNTHLLHTHPELVFLHLQQLHTAHRLMVVLMMLSGEDHTQLSQIFQKLHAVQTEAFSQSDVSNLANKYL